MNRKDWQKAFGPTPDAFRVRVDETLERLEERDMRKRTKFATALIAAVLTVTLLAGAAFAAAKLDIWEALNMANPIIPLESADELVATDLATGENDYFRVTVQEGVYDGFGAIVKLRFEPKDPEKYVIITDMSMLGDLGDDYIAEIKQYEDGSTTERIIGRKDGKEIIHLSTPRLTVNGEPIDAEAFGVDVLFNSYIDRHNSDGSVEFWIDGTFAADLPETLEVILNVCGYDSEHNNVYGTIEGLSFTLIKSNHERIVRLIPVDHTPIEGFELVDCKATFTEVRGYLSAEYIGSAEDEGMGISLNLLNTEGNPITIGGGHCMELENGHSLWEMEMQTFEEIPETIIIEARIIGESAIGQIECKVEAVDE